MGISTAHIETEHKGSTLMVIEQEASLWLFPSDISASVSPSPIDMDQGS